LVTVIFDHRPSYLGHGEDALSLLAMPAGARSYLAFLLDQIATLEGPDDPEILVVPSFEMSDAYRRRIESLAPCGATFARPDRMSEMLARCEPADYLLLVNPLRWPRQGIELSRSLDRREYLAATHFIALGGVASRIRERVTRDDNGDVISVQRHYDEVIWPEVATSCICLSLVPAWSVVGAPFMDLAELRAALASRGVLSRDVPLPVGDVDLSHADGMLALNEAMAVHDIRHGELSGLQPIGSGILAGRQCRIAPTARIVGPVVLHDDVWIADGATVVGPAVVGRGCRIGTGTVVAQSLLAPGVTVADGAALHHRVATGPQNGSTFANDCTDYLDSVPMRAVVSDAHLRQMREVSPINPPRQARRRHLVLKRTLDIIVSALALLVLSPVFALVAVWIKLDSTGPVFFSHRREGKDGKEFACLKFRTMHADAHRQQRRLYRINEVDGPQFKLTHDPRVTRLGRWLRGTNIDELPQLICVLIGHMSLVGPRPSPFRENQVCLPWRRARLSIQPGITGLWQMCRADDRSEGDFHEWIFYDIAYVRYFSIWLDLKILVATVLTGGGRRSVSISWFIPTESNSPLEAAADNESCDPAPVGR